MPVILTKVKTLSSSDSFRSSLFEKSPILKEYKKGHFTLYMPIDSSLSARLRLISNFRRKGFKLIKISPIKACLAKFTKGI